VNGQLRGYTVAPRLRAGSCAGCTVAWYCSACPHGLQVMITTSTRMSCRCFGNMRACLGNMQVLLHVIAAKPFFISTAHEPWRAMRHMSVPEPTSEAGCGSELRDTCQCQNPSRWRGGVRCRWTCGNTGALLDGEAGSRASGHMAAPEPC
jgi:hypothetical protein